MEDKRYSSLYWSYLQQSFIALFLKITPQWRHGLGSPTQPVLVFHFSVLLAFIFFLLSIGVLGFNLSVLFPGPSWSGYIYPLSLYSWFLHLQQLLPPFLSFTRLISANSSCAVFSTSDRSRCCPLNALQLIPIPCASQYPKLDALHQLRKMQEWLHVSRRPFAHRGITWTTCF